MTNNISSNPTQSKDDCYIIAYLDTLGAKKKMDSDVVAFANNLDLCYREAIQILSISNDDFQKQNIFIDKIEYKIFSDNILFYIQIDHLKDKGLFQFTLKYFLEFIAVFQLCSFNHELIYRGSISYGNLLHNQLRVLGKGLIDVVLGEESIAFYPRVIVSNDIAEDYHKIHSHLSKNNIISRNVIDQDFDKLYYINFLSFHDDISEIKRVNSIAQKLSDESSNNIKIVQKYNWLLSYIEKYCYENNILLKSEDISMSNISNLFRLMDEKNISKSVLSKGTGISTGNISDWASGRCMPSADKLEILANFLDCSVDYLLGRDAYYNSNNENNTILEKYNSLNSVGQEKANSYIDDLLGNANYTTSEKVVSYPVTKEKAATGGIENPQPVKEDFETN